MIESSGPFPQSPGMPRSITIKLPVAGVTSSMAFSKAISREPRPHRRHSSCNDTAGPGSNSTTSVRPEVKFVPWKSSRSNSQLASASIVNPPPSVRSIPTAARWSKTKNRSSSMIRSARKKICVSVR